MTCWYESAILMAFILVVGFMIGIIPLIMLFGKVYRMKKKMKTNGVGIP